MPTPLNVAFTEKDAVKALGAKWDATKRFWYVPDGLDLAPFRTWLPDTLANALPEPASQETAQSDALQTSLTGVSLAVYLGQIQTVIQQHCRQPQWVRVDIARVNIRNGHTFLELAEYDAQHTQTASASAYIWAQKISVVDSFVAATGVQLKEGVKLLVRMSPSLHARMGMRYEIHEIDPNFTLGDMALKLGKIREALRTEGVFESNRLLPFPQDYRRVVVISPEGAAGLGDFRAIADQLAEHRLCQFKYLQACFQGPNAKASLLDALKHAATYEHVDAIVMIRGGGAVSDLHWLNELEIARSVCLCQFPVIVGIGHEKDQTILDELAARSCDTPSKVAEFIRSTIFQRAQQAEKNFNDTLLIASRLLENAASLNSSAIEQLRQGARHTLDIEEMNNRNATDSIQAGAQHLVEQSIKAVYWLHDGILASADNALRGAAQQCQHEMGTIRAIGPQVLRQSEQDVISGQVSVLASADSIMRGQETVLHHGIETIRSVGPQMIRQAEQTAISNQTSVLASADSIMREAESALHHGIDTIRSIGPQKLRQAEQVATSSQASVLTSADAIMREAEVALHHSHALVTERAARGLEQAEQTLHRAFDSTLQNAQHTCEAETTRLKGTMELILMGRPEQTLQRGFALVYAGERVLPDVAHASKESQMTIHFRDGQINVQPVPETHK